MTTHARALRRDTWRSFDRLVDPRTGLPADNIGGDLDPRTRSAYTSPTNIAMYLWATLAARDLGFIGADEASSGSSTTLTSVERLERHEPSGQFCNWYDPQTAARSSRSGRRPPNNPVYPFAVERRQRLAGVRPADGRERRARSSATGRGRSPRA